MKKNKGYTLTEMIVVIAIMAILSGVSVASLGTIKKAKYATAVSEFRNQLTSLCVITKATSQAVKQTSPTTTNPNSIYPLCMRLQKNADDTYWLVLGYHTDGGFVPKNTNETDAKQNRDILVIPKIVNVSYDGDASQVAPNMNDGPGYVSNATPIALIEFRKTDGSVLYGAGKYTFRIDDSQGRVIGEVELDESTGKHSVK